MSKDNCKFASKIQLYIWIAMDLSQFFRTTVFGIEIGGPILFCAKALLIYAFTRLLVMLVRFFFRRAERKRVLIIDSHNSGFIQRMIVYSIYIVGATGFLALIPGMEQVTKSLLAGAGILAMAVGLASQEALGNIVSGIFIVFAKPFRLGDFIQVDGGSIAGTVTEITLRHTLIRSPDNRMIIIPNSKINSSTITNSTIGDQATCAFVEVGVSYDTPLPRAIDVMRNEIEKHPSLIDHRTSEEKVSGVPKVIIRVMQLGDSSITLRAWAWAATAGDAFAMKCDLLLCIKERFDEEGIEIPYPYFNQIVKQS